MKASFDPPFGGQEGPLLVVTLVMALLIAIQAGAAGSALAHGGQPNLTLYCQQLHGEAAMARYNELATRWECFLPGRVGVQGLKPDRIQPINVADVCERQYHEARAHFHEGDNVHLSAAVHCGKAAGFVAELPVETRLSVCNRGTNKVWFAYGYADAWQPSRGWSATGWYAVEAMACRTLALGRSYDGDLYIYGQRGAASAIAGRDASFCVDHMAAFDLAQADRHLCRGGGLRRVAMRRMHRQGNVFAWTFE